MLGFSFKEAFFVRTLGGLRGPGREKLACSLRSSRTEASLLMCLILGISCEGVPCLYLYQWNGIETVKKCARKRYNITERRNDRRNRLYKKKLKKVLHFRLPPRKFNYTRPALAKARASKTHVNDFLPIQIHLLHRSLVVLLP